jgi:transmembrane sensor
MTQGSNTRAGDIEERAATRGVSLEEEAAETFVQRLHGEWTAVDQTALEHRLQTDPEYAAAYRRIHESWDSLDTHAETPELMAFRSEALSEARRTHARRWLRAAPSTRMRWRWAASIVVGTVALAAAAWQFSPFGMRPGEYRTDIGEQRIIELDDHSRVALDAATKVRVRYTDETRLIELQQGQAQFSVAKDPTRPFKVVAGNQTIVALGTVFTVECLGQSVHVAMMEGRVAIVPQQTAGQKAMEESAKIPRVGAAETPSTAMSDAVSERASDTIFVPPPTGPGVPADPIELSAGQELRINATGETMLIPQADLEAATAWRKGKVILRKEPLSEAVRKLNRYSRLQIQIDDQELAARDVSGVFEAGDTQGFLTAVQRIYPTISADYSDSDRVRLSLNH